MKNILSSTKISRAAIRLCVPLCCLLTPPSYAIPPVAFDMDRAREICDSIPLDNIEGIWIYPADNVSVMVSRKEHVSGISFDEYEIMIIESYDGNLIPGECIGTITASSDAKKFSIELFTERKGLDLLKPKKCTASLSNDCDVLTINYNQSKYKLRLNLNPSVLLPNLWKSVIRIGTTTSGKESDYTPAGMIKIYPSYDGNGSTRRKPRYL
ncbi:MAG: hypothetical protein K2G52_12970 [Muribaculaceae bacterium]|nr:hypothetical protein [Muribaculaceae bacterium]